ncbi:purine permease [Tsukamurella tyrosinosolvens]|uniref:nucleobase:cation symporter-2 family protein n=1 Tax=Tsukamurella tyrosinosolvens TaxID=57704 RepID=UPI000793D77F|nr:nucleobase:cation symporter-2 family protein [Tsukamurella tyrosinosolvens]AUN39842.1 uracil permease [Tsukamurella tyrosinosolvens]KXP05277.1 uracil permease [Tsukamurella tyrosinosolvens]KZL94679.1 uracil permease [Tsukamurella tyrosinosolvens]MCA4994184.1 purine permease [Tsukamurella tyrosinosolvens]MEC4614544.1 nucleobase:cation symporter-2 family protein [Tsukamurella tyrosinosolvens]
MTTATEARPEDERLPLGKTFVYGLQHILTMYGGVIAPPLIVGGAAGLSATDMSLLVTAGLFVSGLATILQTIGIGPLGARLPIVQGLSFASVSTMTAIAQDGGVRPIFGAIIVAGLIGLVLSSVFAKLVRYFPPVVTGTIITVIGLSLLPVTFNWAQGGNAKAADYGSMANIGLAGATVLIILVISRLFQGAISRLSILIGIVVGTVIAAFMGKLDFSKVGDGPIFSLPPIMHFGSPTFQIGAIISMTIVILVIMTETTADILAIGEIVGTPVDSKRVANGLRADMLSTAVAPAFSAFPCSAFAQNVGLVALTGIKSRYVVAMGGGILAFLGLLPVVGRVIAAIPYPVLGGAGLVLFGSVAASGIKTLSRVNFDGNLNMVIVAVSLGMGMIPVAAPDFWHAFPTAVGTVMHSGISAAAVVAVVLNFLFNEITAGNRPDVSVFAAAPDERGNPVPKDD